MTDRDKIKLIKSGFEIIKISGAPATSIRKLNIVGNNDNELLWKTIREFKSVKKCKEEFDSLTSLSMIIDGTGL